MNDLRNEWETCARALGATDHLWPVFRIVELKYGEAHRAYHNLEHVRDVLARIGEARELCGRPELVRMAAFFHDAEYNPLAKGNEKASAELAAVLLEMMGVVEADRTEVARLIMATEHKEAPADVAAAVLVDADLAIFAAPRPRFDEYERGIRQEHGWMPDGDFAASRRAVLERFLVRPRIYTTDFFYDRYEAAARRNLAWSANRLML